MSNSHRDSFSHKVKAELCGLPSAAGSAAKDELYGILLFGKVLSPRTVTLQTEHRDVARKAVGLMRDVFGARPASHISKHTEGRSMTTVSLADPDAAKRIYDAFGYSERTVSLRINHANFDGEADMAAFLRGVFLICGTMVDPEKDYHLEFVTPYLNLSRDLAAMLSDIGFEPKTASRKGNRVVYFKDSSQIEDILTYMGAQMCSLEIMNIKIYKNMRNKANRVTNCETANISKTVNASIAQVEAIRRLKREHGFDILPEELREVAQLRVDNPDMSLRELGRLLSTPLTRSGVNHRLMKIMELAGSHDSDGNTDANSLKFSKR